MPSKKIVLDTNCLLVSISKYGEAYPVWRGFLDGRYTLCVSTEILEEYEEIIANMATPDVARNVVDAILKRSRRLTFQHPARHHIPPINCAQAKGIP